MKSLLWGDLSVHSDWALVSKATTVATTINQNLFCLVNMRRLMLTTQSRLHRFKPFFKAQISAALACQFETSNLVSRVTRERNMEREPHPPNKFVTNRSLHQRYLAMTTMLGDKDAAIPGQDCVGGSQLIAGVISDKCRQF